MLYSLELTVTAVVEVVGDVWSSWRLTMKLDTEDDAVAQGDGAARVMLCVSMIMQRFEPRVIWEKDQRLI